MASDKHLTLAELAAVRGGEEKTNATFVRDFVIPNSAAWVATIPCYAGAAAAVRNVKNPLIRYGVPIAADVVCDFSAGYATYFGLTDKIVSAYGKAKSYITGK